MRKKKVQPGPSASLADKQKLAKQYSYQFRSTADSQLALLPPEVRADYAFCLLPAQGYSLELADFLLTSASNGLQTANQLQQMWGRRTAKRIQDYIAFCHLEQVRAQRGDHISRMQRAASLAPPSVTVPTFPPWDHNPENSLLAPPSAVYVDKFEEHAYDAIYPHIYSDLIRRSPGRFMSSDGTFKLTKITISTGRIAVLFMGEDSTICGFYVVGVRPGAARPR